jgi:membrane fusion protein, multidrug efflux system
MRALLRQQQRYQAMGKVEAFRASEPDGLAEIEHTGAGVDRRKESAEAPHINPPPSAKAPPTIPVQPVAKSTVVPSRRRLPSLRTSLMVAGILAVVVGSTMFWLRGGRYATTDDAYVQADKVLVTTDVSGLVSSVNVREGEEVEAGNLLFQIDPLQFQIALDSAQANLREIALTIQSMKSDYQVTLSNAAAQQAQVALDQVTNERNAALLNGDNVARQTYDQSRYMLQLDQSKLVSLQQTAQVELAKLDGNPDIPVTEHPLYRQAKAQVDEAQRQLDHASVRAPFSGVVTQVDALQPGTYLVSQTAALTGTGAIALVSTDRTWVVAQMKETDLTYVQRGNHVDVSVDTFPDRIWSGTVESISPASGSEFSVLPAQNSSGNWVKVVQRIPVKIAIARKPGAPILRSGMSVYVRIDTGHHRSWADLF